MNFQKYCAILETLANNMCYIASILSCIFSIFIKNAVNSTSEGDSDLKQADLQVPRESRIHELETRLRILEREYHMVNSLVENSTDAIQISDKNLITLKVNKAYEVLTGIKREELVGIPVDDLVQNHLISESCGAIVSQTRKPHTIIQTFYRTGRSAHVSCNPVFDKDGEIEFYICNDRDLNEISNLQLELHQVKKLNDRYLSELETLKAIHPNKGTMVIEDKKMLTVLALAQRVARVDSTALILGETGVGKDEIAHFIHQNSQRADQKFVSINCGAIAESLFESEMFGHEAFAYTGAGNKVKIGFLEVANGGTLFLDEVGELTLHMQTKLLHFLQNQTFMRVGSNKPIKVDVRIIAATNRDLKAMVKEKQFREDLYYRLNVIPIHIPPLRERKNDIIPLANFFLAQYNKKYGFSKRLSPKACYSLLNYSWAGNIRELKNIIEQAVIMAYSDTIQPDDFTMSTSGKNEKHEDIQDESNMQELLERTELQFLSTYYSKYGNVRSAASHLSMSPSTFVRHRTQLMEKYGTSEN